MIEVKGYMVEAQFDGTALHAHGTNKAARIALAGQDHDTDVTVPTSHIASVDLKPAKRLTNGNLRVHTTDGRTYQLHYLRKHQDDFTQLARALGWDGQA